MTRYRSGFLLALLILIMNFPCLAATPGTVKKMVSSAVGVKTPVGSGSGTLILHDVVATACHVVEKAWDGFFVNTPGPNGQTKEYPAVPLVSDVWHDLCALLVPGISDDPNLRQALTTSQKPKVGDHVTAVSGRVNAAFSTGEVVRLEEVSSGDCTNMHRERGHLGRRPRKRGGTCIIADSPTEPGWSGAGLYESSSAKLLGIIVSGDAKDGRTWTVAVPSSWVKEVREGAAFRRRIILGWMACRDFECASDVIWGGIRRLSGKSRFRDDVLAEWAAVLADRKQFAQAEAIAGDLPTGPRFKALLGLATAHAAHGDPQAAKAVFRELLEFTQKARRRQSVRIRELTSMAEAQADAGFVEEAKETLFAALKALNDVESLSQTKIMGLLRIGSTASGARLFELADMVFHRATLEVANIRREEARNRLIGYVEEAIFSSRMARRGASFRDMKALIRVDERLKEADRFARDRRSLGPAAYRFLNSTAKVAAELYASEEAVARKLVSALVKATEHGFQARKARALSEVANELIEVDRDHARELYARAHKALATLTKFYDDLEDRRSQNGEPRDERRTSKRVDRARFMVAEGLARTGRYEEALGLCAQITEQRLRDEAYRWLAEALLSEGRVDKAIRTAANLFDRGLFLSVFVASSSKLYE